MAIQNKELDRIDELVRAHCRREARLGTGELPQVNGQKRVCGTFG